MKRTPEEIETMIAALEAEKERLPEISAFGNNNWKTNDAMIEVLRGKYETEDDIYDIENSNNREKVSSMLIALSWLNGDVEADELV